MGNLKILLIILGVCFYLVLPFDLIPEIIFGPIGVIDDVLFLASGAISVGSFFFGILRERNEEQVRAR